MKLSDNGMNLVLVIIYLPTVDYSDQLTSKPARLHLIIVTSYSLDKGHLAP